MKVTAKYENLTGKEVKIVDVPYFNEDDGNTYPYLGIQMSDYVSADLVTPNHKDSLQIFVDYVNQFRWLTSNQLDSLCQRFIDVFWTDFSIRDVQEEFGI